MVRPLPPMRFTALAVSRSLLCGVGAELAARDRADARNSGLEETTSRPVHAATLPTKPAPPTATPTDPGPANVTRPAGPRVPSKASRLQRRSTAVLGLALVALGGVFTVHLVTAYLPFVLTLAGVLLLRGSGYDDRRVLSYVLLLGLVGMGASLLLGISLTDEPFSTPGYAQFFPDLYGHRFVQTYDVPLWPHVLPSAVPSYTYTTDSYDLYLPLMTFIQIPGAPYQLVSLGCWAAATGVAWKAGRGLAATTLVTPYVGLLAAGGFNDFVPILLMTASLTAGTLRGSLWTEALALGTKQFAPVISVIVHAVRREWARLALAVVITGAILLPFYLVDPHGVVCHAILVSDSCNGGNASASNLFLGHLNYYLYPLWLVGLFHGTLARWTRRAVERILPHRG